MNIKNLSYTLLMSLLLFTSPSVLTKKIPKHRKKRIEKINRNKTRQSKTISHMNTQELIAAKNLLLSKKDTQSALKYVEQILKTTTDLAIISETTIELADLYFTLGELKKAELLFNEFAQLYPGSDKVEYASYKAILCSFYTTLGIENDQTKTHETIALIDAFIERKNIFTTYLDEVTTMRTSCYKKAVESEIGIVDFYLKSNRLVSAQHRLQNIRKKWLPLYPETLAYISPYEKKCNNNPTILALNTPIANSDSSLESKQNEPKRFSARF